MAGLRWPPVRPLFYINTKVNGALTVGVYRKHLLLDLLKVSLTDNKSPVCVAIPADFTRKDETHLSQLLFQYFSVPGLYFALSPLMTLYGFGTTTTGLCIDIGHSYTGNDTIL